MPTTANELSQDDEVLMSAVANGDRAAFEQLVHRHIDKLYAFAMRLSHDRARAEDLVQETWLAVWQKAGSYQSSRARVSTWLHTITRNRFIDQQRHPRMSEVFAEELNTREKQQLDAVQPQESWQNTQDFAPLNGRSPEGDLAQLSAAIDDLPEQQRCAIALAYLQGFSNREAATIMGLRLRALESLLARARRALTEERVEG